MANFGPDSNTSQFFVTLAPAPHLDGRSVVFGRVVSGIDVVRRVAALEADEHERPRRPVLIEDCGEMS